MEIPVIYIFTHDSIGVGEDGPTHQPVEHLASLRAIPGLITLRPADANEVIDKRRRFTEAVLAGVTAGVLGIDAEGKINLANRSALNLLGAERSDLLGQPVADAVPELAELFQQATNDGNRPRQQQLTINRYGRERVLNVRVTTESSATEEHGYVMTLDEITDLVSA